MIDTITFVTILPLIVYIIMVFAMLYICSLYLKYMNEDGVYQLGVNEARHHDFNVAGVIGVVCFVIGVMIGVMV